MLAPKSQHPSEQKFGDVSRHTLRVFDVIGSWIVNTYYNYLHQEAVSLHTKGRVGSITDGYRFIVKEYLASFGTGEGYKRLVISLHKYYVDNSNCSAIAFDEWTREVLEQFVPLDYKAIMSNEQQDVLLRNILISSVEQFSSEVICTKLLDLLISNHDEPSIAPRMKASVKAILLAERQKIFNSIHKSSTGTDTGMQMTMKKEILALIEENVILKSKNGKLAESIKKSLDGLKMRDKAISALKVQVTDLERQIQSFQSRHEQVNVIPRTHAEEFKSTVGQYTETRPRVLHQKPGDLQSRLNSNPGSQNTLPGFMAKNTQPVEVIQPRNSIPKEEIKSWTVEPVKEDAVPLSHIEKAPEPFEMADSEGAPEDGEDADENETGGLEAPPTGSDTLALGSDEFWNN